MDQALTHFQLRVVQKGIQDASTEIREGVNLDCDPQYARTAVLLRSTIDRGSGVLPSGYISSSSSSSEGKDKK
jgi:hypothetical protein